MGMADSYYTPPDDDFLECEYCEGTGNADDGECPECYGKGYIDDDKICGICDSYPCRCDDDYDSYQDAQADMWGY
jgi:DnaJ-class molecular chaperone